MLGQPVTGTSVRGDATSALSVACAGRWTGHPAPAPQQPFREEDVKALYEALGEAKILMREGIARRV